VKLRADFAARSGEKIQEIVIDKTFSHRFTISKIYSFSYKYSCARFELR
jgi:hypothetical protein